MAHGQQRAYMPVYIGNIAKGTTDPRIEFSLPKLLILVISQGQTQNLIKFHLQNIDQAPTSKSRHQQTSVSRLNLKFKILTKPGFRISTKIQLHYHFKTSAAKYWTNSCFKSCLNFNFKILTRPCAQSLNKSLALANDRTRGPIKIYWWKLFWTWCQF